MKALKKKHEKYTSGYERWTEYNEFENEINMKASTGYWRKTKYDERGYTIHRCDSLGFDESSSYDKQGNKLVVKRGKLIREQHFYDDQGNMLRSEYFNESSGKLEYWYKYKYDNRGNVIYSTDYSGYETHCEYDENNRPIHFWDNEGEELWYHYDENGFLCHEIYCDGRESWYKHDSNGRETYSKLYDGKETWTEYDDEHNRIIKKTQLGTKTFIQNYENSKHTYSKYEDESSFKEEWYDFNKNGKIVHFKEHEELFECDKQGNRLHTKSIFEIEKWWWYNEHGKIIHYKDYDGKEYTNVYDGNEHKIILADKLGNRRIEEYDDDWDLIYSKDWNGNECWQEYYDKQKENN